MNVRIPTRDHVKIEFTGADIAGFMSFLSRNNIAMYDVVWKDTLSVTATVLSEYHKIIMQYAEKMGVAVKIIGVQGASRIIVKLLRRPMLILGMALLLYLSVFLPTRVLKIEIEGNHFIPERYIAEAAEQCGIYFGAKRSVVRSEIVKNKLLEAVPQLQWAGVNTYGCRAVISVTEKQSLNKEIDQHKVSSVIASTDGIIESVTVTKGNTLCHVGQAVKKGQVLISGYLDCGNIIQATNAEGEIFAYTKRSINVLRPLDYTKKEDLSNDIKKFSIIFGKIRINLSKDSGISTTGCDKMYLEYPLVLPGGFMLPVALAVEHCKGYNDTEPSTMTTTNVNTLSAFAEEYLSQQMISGSVVSKSEDVKHEKNAVCLRGVYNCREMIGRTRVEEIFDGKDHG